MVTKSVEEMGKLYPDDLGEKVWKMIFILYFTQSFSQTLLTSIKNIILKQHKANQNVMTSAFLTAHENNSYLLLNLF